MTKPYQQFRNKAEALDALLDMNERANRAETVATYWPSATTNRAEHAKAVEEYRAEAARIRALLPTLPD